MKKRKDGRWVKVITLNGKKISFYSRAETEKQAEREIRLKMLEYSEKEEKGKTLLEVSEEWYDFHTKHLAYSTSARYSRYMKQLNEYLPGFYIKEVDEFDIENIMNDFSDKRYSSKTIRDFLSVVKSIFRYAHKKHYISENVTLYISPKKGRPSVARDAINEEQTLSVAKNTDCTFGLLAFFYLCTGLRKGEVLALQWEDIDFNNKRINVDKTVYFIGNNPHIKYSPKTKSGIRYVILPDRLADKLFPLKGKPNEYVFSKNGNLIDKSYYTRQWNKYKAESGINTTAHPLRHTYSTLIFEAGIPEKDAQTLMGHSSITVTHNVYTHIRKKRMDETANKLNEYISLAVCRQKTEK